MNSAVSLSFVRGLAEDVQFAMVGATRHGHELSFYLLHFFFAYGTLCTFAHFSHVTLLTVDTLMDANDFLVCMSTCESKRRNYLLSDLQSQTSLGSSAMSWCGYVDTFDFIYQCRGPPP